MSNRTPRNRIRSFTRWPECRQDRIEAAKVELGVVGFFDRLARQEGLESADERAGAIPDIYLKRARVATDILIEMNVPTDQWGVD